MRVRQTHLNLVRSEPDDLARFRSDSVEHLTIEDAVIQPQYEFTRRSVERFETHRRCCEWAVNAGRAVVECGTPHPVIDANGWGNVHTGEADPTATLRS